MNTMNYFMTFYIFFMTCFMLFFYYKHLLMTLIMLEFIMISVMYNMFNIMIYLDINMIYIIFFLGMAVCEGALGLSLIVLMVRFYGNDYLNSLSLMKW